MVCFRHAIKLRAISANGFRWKAIFFRACFVTFCFVHNKGGIHSRINRMAFQLDSRSQCSHNKILTHADTSIGHNSTGKIHKHKNTCDPMFVDAIKYKFVTNTNIYTKYSEQHVFCGVYLCIHTMSKSHTTHFVCICDFAYTKDMYWSCMCVMPLAPSRQNSNLLINGLRVRKTILILFQCPTN